MLACLLLAPQDAAPPDKVALKASLKEVDIPASWIYDDIDAGFAEAKKTGKPLLVAFR
jgi:hypothetical protein